MNMKRVFIILTGLFLLFGHVPVSYGLAPHKDKKHKGSQPEQKVASNISMLIEAKKSEITGDEKKGGRTFPAIH
jgi:hypothetical protein